MALELPVEFKVRSGQLEGELNKAGAEASAAIKAQAAEQERALKYLDTLRQRYFGEEQRRRERELAEATRAAAAEAAEKARQVAYVAQLQQRAFADAQRARQQEEASAARFASALASVQAATAGLSTEQQRLNALQEQAATLYQRGALSAEQYAAAVNDIGARNRQLSATAATAASSTGAVGAAMGNLRSQLIDVGVGLQGGQNPLTIISQQGPQIVEAFLSAEGAASAFIATLTSLSVVLVPLGLAIAAVAYEHHQAAEAAERQRKLEEALKTTVERSTKAQQSFAEQIKDYGERQRVAAGLIDATTAAHDRERLALQIKAKEQQGAAVAEVAAARAAMANVGTMDTSTKAYRDAARALLEAENRQRDIIQTSREAATEFEITAAAELAAANAKKGRAADAKSASAAARLAIKEERLDLKLLLQDIRATEAAEKERLRTLEKAREGLDKLHASTVMTIVDETERIRLAAQAQRERAAGYAYEAQAASRSSDERKLIARELAETLQQINVQEIVDVREAEAKKVAEAQKAADAIAKAHQEAQQQIASTISTASSGLSGIASLVGGPVAGAVTDLVLNLSDTIASVQEELMSLPDILTSIPDLLVGLVQTIVEDAIPAILRAVPELIAGLLEAVPVLIQSIVEAVPEIIEALVAAAPNVIYAIILALPGIIQALIGLLPTLIVGLVRALIQALGEAVSWLRSDALPALLEGFGESLKLRLASVIQYIWGRIKQLFQLGDLFGEAKETGRRARKMNDSPGVVRWGDRGPGDFRRDDWVAAAPTREALQRQVGAPAPSPMTIDLADGHLAFDGALRRATKQPRTRRELKGFTVARGLA